MMGGYKRPASLTPAELLVQTSIRKRASAFVDARDDLETKIGRLSRRLNFLLTESELWRQKFVSFEEYAETLSAEAAELRAKIGKEQRESKRLSGLVQLTAHEKEELKHSGLSVFSSALRPVVTDLLMTILFSDRACRHRGCASRSNDRAGANARGNGRDGT
jgi:hypothetical protein